MYDPENLEYIVDKLEENSVDHKALSAQIKCTIGRKEKGCDIKDIFRIKNPFLEDAFHKKLTEEERRHTSFSMLFQFHGTSGVAIDAVIKNGFDVDATPSDINMLDGRKRSKKAKVSISQATHQRPWIMGTTSTLSAARSS